MTQPIQLFLELHFHGSGPRVAQEKHHLHTSLNPMTLGGAFQRYCLSKAKHVSTELRLVLWFGRMVFISSIELVDRHAAPFWEGVLLPLLRLWRTGR
jgi:hypothetical protein